VEPRSRPLSSRKRWRICSPRHAELRNRRRVWLQWLCYLGLPKRERSIPRVELATVVRPGQTPLGALGGLLQERQGQSPVCSLGRKRPQLATRKKNYFLWHANILHLKDSNSPASLTLGPLWITWKASLLRNPNKAFGGGQAKFNLQLLPGIRVPYLARRNRTGTAVCVGLRWPGIFSATIY
jgi:hypothetical protein